MIHMDWRTGVIKAAPGIRESKKTIGDLEQIFADSAAWREMNPETVVYRVQAWTPLNDNENALSWGSTVVEPGHVGSEYFMTHGHFHAKRDRSEYYSTLEGVGALILMDENRKAWFEPMSAGSVHFIPPHIAHRVANSGNIPLRFVACWPSDAGHDYESIRLHGFSARFLCVDGKPQFCRE